MPNKLFSMAHAATPLALAALFAAGPAAADTVVDFSAGEVIEIVYVDIKHGQQDTFFVDYFPNVEPLFADHGGRVVAQFETFDVVEGDITPQHVLLLQWPSAAAFDAALKDDRAAPFVPTRSEALRDLHFGLFTVDQDTTVTFRDDVVYEFFAAIPGNPDAPAMLGRFFQNVIPTAMGYGRATELSLQPVAFDGDNYDRPIAGLASWPSAAHFYRFTNTTVFRDNVRDLRDPALAQMEIINTRLVDR